MPINQNNIDRLLAALAAKDIPALVAQQVNIPFLSQPYTAAQLQAWLDKRISRLSTVRDATEAQAVGLRTTLYNGLNAAGQAVADKIIAGEPYTFPANLSSANYDRLIGIKLITFVLN